MSRNMQQTLFPEPIVPEILPPIIETPPIILNRFLEEFCYSTITISQETKQRLTSASSHIKKLALETELSEEIIKKEITLMLESHTLKMSLLRFKLSCLK